MLSVFTIVKYFRPGYVPADVPPNHTRQKGVSMTQSNKIDAVEINTADGPAKPRPVTRDSGRVRIGGGAIHYSDAAPVREPTKDAGRVHIGGGAIHF